MFRPLKQAVSWVLGHRQEVKESSDVVKAIISMLKDGKVSKDELLQLQKEVNEAVAVILVNR